MNKNCLRYNCTCSSVQARIQEPISTGPAMAKTASCKHLADKLRDSVEINSADQQLNTVSEKLSRLVDIHLELPNVEKYIFFTVLVFP